ncbi:MULTISPECIES: GPO family capsid scaffolding protein [unclassified Acinetobacter]|uniref:GPO family capsid scaffolding protein n=1 Tax=unclassified Acinetobacter TaxID=196816 RepID=UPI0022ABCCDD|nr:MULTISPECIES: GPO family capsid scaffolding protein [unclassified Acinetobacter]WAU72940.1 GPO family capsid scaffolding protein [Acinetobacter sp. TR11]WAU76035.1 GPO family capsid scaffolding protein [Acinetobacter sp. TR3]
MTALPGEGRVEKRFRVAREGQTVDGRPLERQELLEMASTYNIEYYGGRINVEHIKGWSPEPPFNAYGDIISVEAVEENGLMCLYNTISALPNLISLNKAGQKIYPSIEFYRNFANSGKAYQVGLGLTDDPNCLNTEAIKFSANKNVVKTSPDKEIFMSEQNTQDENKGLLQQIKELMSPKPKPVETQDDTVAQGVLVALKAVTDLANGFAEFKVEITQKLDGLSTHTAQPPATVPSPAPAPAVPPSTPPEPQNFSNPADAFNQALQPLQQQLNTLQQSLQTLSTTPVNTPPPAPGNVQGGATPY